MKSFWQALTDPKLRGPRWLGFLKRLLSIRASILLVYLIVVGGGFYVIMRTMILEIRPRYLESMEESLVDTANILAALVEHEAEKGGNNIAAIENVFTKAYSRKFEAKIHSLEKRTVDLQVYLTDHNGVVLFDSAEPEALGSDYSQWRDVVLTLNGEYGARATWVEHSGRSELVLRVAAPVRIAGEIVGVVSVGKPTTYVNELVYAAEQRFRVYAIVAVVAVLGLGALLSVWLTQPIKRLIRYATAVKEGRKASYPRLFGFEANDLGRAFEEMREALEGKQYVERYVQSLTHQLKSPLSGISGAAELLEGEMNEEERRRFTGNVRRESDRIRRIVDRMLELAAIESRRGLEDVEEIQMDKLLVEIAGDFQPAFEAESVLCELDLAKGISIRGERFLLRQAVFNVLQNAIEFSPENGVVRLILNESNGVVRICVSDDGPGIPEYAFGKLTDRFYSLVRPKSGEKSSGIGLSFVKEIMNLHAGEISYKNEKSGGATFVLSFHG